MSLEGKAALVTGGGQGIGFATARHLLERGMAVAVLEADAWAAAVAEAALGGLGPVAMVVGDVASEADVDRAVGEAERRFGRLDALINNAGFGIWKPLAELSLAEWNRVLAVNLTGAFLSARRAAPVLARDGGGAIVNIASTRALMSEPDGEAYGASKGGLVALTHALAVSLGPVVRVNCISPGWIDVSGLKVGGAAPDALSAADHAQHPAGRVGRPEDVAAAVAWLIGPEAGFVTGANVVIDGGMTRKMIYV
ncbi:MAG: SDR family oxidoreductase [Rhodospirillales bacterium]|nr:SDR family oxidoreductase [Rhodospirillales bacterium]